MRRRISKDFIKAKKDELARVKDQRDKYRTIQDGKDTLFWKEIDGRISVHAESVERKLDEWEKTDDKMIFSLLERRKMLRFFKDLVNESESVLLVLDGRVEKLESEIRGMRAGKIVRDV